MNRNQEANRMLKYFYVFLFAIVIHAEFTFARNRGSNSIPLQTIDSVFYYFNKSLNTDVIDTGSFYKGLDLINKKSFSPDEIKSLKDYAAELKNQGNHYFASYLYATIFEMLTNMQDYDAAINFGNSGGPLVNLKGEAIGINTAITAQGSGIGFAVPMNMVKDIIVQLKDSGSVTRGYLGITIGDVTEELKEAKGLAAAKGVIINDIVPGGPASKSELQREDIVLKVNGAETNSAKELQQNVAKIKPGAQAKLEVLRGKKTLTVSVKVGNLSESSAQPEKATKPDGEDRLGILVGMASDGSGVQIQGIEAGSAADEAGLVEGDIVRRIKDEVVKNIADYQRIVKGLKSKSHALFDIQRGDLKSFIVVKVP